MKTKLAVLLLPQSTAGRTELVRPSCAYFLLKIPDLREQKTHDSQSFSVRGAGLLLCDDGVDVYAETLGNVTSVSRISFVEVLNL
jgi:hypothetical protein